jgi:hypothetical protein
MREARDRELNKGLRAKEKTMTHGLPARLPVENQ